MNEVLTTDEVASALGVKPRTVTKYIERKLLTSTKKGRDHFITRDEVERFQRERKKAGRPNKSISLVLREDK